MTSTAKWFRLRICAALATAIVLSAFAVYAAWTRLHFHDLIIDFRPGRVALIGVAQFFVVMPLSLCGALMNWQCTKPLVYSVFALAFPVFLLVHLFFVSGSTSLLDDKGDDVLLWFFLVAVAALIEIRYRNLHEGQYATVGLIGLSMASFYVFTMYGLLTAGC